MPESEEQRGSRKVTVMFRRLYWVTELLLADGRSEVVGVYTSIPDLIRHGIRNDGRPLRLTLTKLDSDKLPFGTWTGPDFRGLEEDVQQFVRTEEFGVDEVKALLRALQPARSAA